MGAPPEVAPRLKCSNCLGGCRFYSAVDAGIASATDLTHTACPLVRLNFVKPEFRARSKRHLCAPLYRAKPMVASGVPSARLP